MEHADREERVLAQGAAGAKAPRGMRPVWYVLVLCCAVWMNSDHLAVHGKTGHLGLGGLRQAASLLRGLEDPRPRERSSLWGQQGSLRSAS